MIDLREFSDRRDRTDDDDKAISDATRLADSFYEARQLIESDHNPHTTIVKRLANEIAMQEKEADLLEEDAGRRYQEAQAMHQLLNKKSKD